jgi:hypothetical protein
MQTAGISCEVCGSAAGGGFFGILPFVQSHYVGIQYRHTRFTTNHTDLLSGHRSYSGESFQQLQLTGRWNINARTHLYVLLPWHMNERTESGVVDRFIGIGDAQLMVHRVLLNRDDLNAEHWKHLVTVGGGVKLPIGAYRITGLNGEVNPYLQPGTGSWDAVGYANYTVRKNMWGGTTQWTYSFNTRNSSGFRYANKCTGSVQAFFWKRLGIVTLLPMAGAELTIAGADLDDTTVLHQSGGDSLFGQAGCSAYLSRVLLHFRYQFPLTSTNNIIESKPAYMVQALYFF